MCLEASAAGLEINITGTTENLKGRVENKDQAGLNRGAAVNKSLTFIFNF